MRITEVVSQGLTLDVLDDGPIDGDPVVLLHGFPERATSWRRVAPLLHQAGYRTLALDQRGYSPRARPQGRKYYSMGRLAGDVGALIDAIGMPVHLVGHDWGAGVGWVVAATSGDRVRSYTALSVPHPGAYARALRGRQGLKSWYMALFNLPWLPEFMAGHTGFMEWFLERSGMDREELERYRGEILRAGALTGGLNWYRGMGMDLKQRVPRVSIPATMVWSDGDIAIDRSGVLMCRDYCKGEYELIELKGVSHWIPTQAPEAAAEAILGRIRSVEPGGSPPADSSVVD